MSSHEINFYVHRIRQAFVAELFHRVSEAFFVKKAGRLVRAGRLSFAVPDIPQREIEELKLPEMESCDSSNHMQETIQGRPCTLNSEESAPQRFEKTWRKTLFSDIKPDNSIDIRAVWEPARLQHISSMLADVNGLGGTYQEAAKGAAKDMVFEWLASNPFLFGPHYLSAMECGLRIPVFFYCMKGVDNLTVTERLRLLSAIYEHAWWVSHHLSLYSSLGNCTIAEAMGLIFAGAVFKSSKEGKEWLNRGCGLLEQELTHQILGDGGPTEQSLGSHRFVLDLFWLALDFLEKNNLGEYSAWKPRLIAGEKFLKAFTDESGNIPSIGDSDDGHAIAPGIHPKRIGDDFGESRSCVTFPESGYTVIRGANGLVLTFDHGPLGMAPLYNHGHADALSVTISVAGEQILVDPGTYRYNGVPKWRRYFKGTKVHNTVMIDRQDQAVLESSFIWSHPYKASLIRVSNDGGNPYIDAIHDGYTRLRKPVTHRRVVDFCSDSLFLIKDSFSGKGWHKFELNFHLHPDATLLWKDRYSVIKKSMAELTIALLGEKKFRIACGETTLPFGWYSPAYGLKVQTPVLSCEVYGQPDQVSFVTAVSLGRITPDFEGLEKMAYHH